MRGLVLHLDGHRESRKAVIAVTLGWRLFTANQTRATDEGTVGRIMGVQPLGVGPDGRLGTPDRGTCPGWNARSATSSASQGAMADSRQMFQDLIGEANRTEHQLLHASMPPACGPRGGRWPTTPAEAQLEARNRERMPLHDDARLDPHARRARPTAWPSSTATTSRPACSASPTT